MVEVVVTLRAPALADYRPARSLAGRRLAVGSSASQAYLQTLATAQDRVAVRLARAIPSAWVRWHYSVVANGLALVLPAGDAARLTRIGGIARVWPSFTYRPLLDRTPRLIGAPQLWGPALATAWQGEKIGIIDDGIDQTHPFFAPAGYVFPPGFPKGDTRYTTPKVIVARAFPPARTTYANASLPFDPGHSDHATHVAGIAAGNNGTPALRTRLSGIAPRAYLGNYKALTVPSPNFGLDGNSPELVAAIEAAVRDGMDVINLSLGEPEVDPRRDIVVQALDAAARAGVVPVVAAGNDFADFGHGSVGSPANAPRAIAVAASTGAHGSPAPDRVTSFSSVGPTPYSLQLKPDVAAPGSRVLSSVPASEGSWNEFSGTSMAAPHVAGAVALLRQRHPTWSVAQLKSALVLTGAPLHDGGREAATTREGGGRIDLPRADAPLLFAQPASVSVGLVRPGTGATRRIAFSDAGGGVGRWSAQVRLQVSAPGVRVTFPAALTVPARPILRVAVTARARARDVTGFVVLSRGGVVRRVPFWFRVARARLGFDRARRLARPGVYRATTVGAPSRVTSYRYPDLEPTTFSFPRALAGPEVVYRLRLRRPVSNFGVAVLRGSVVPRIVRNADENRLAGYTALPLDLNVYRSSYGSVRPISAVVLPSAGTFELVFDSTRGARRGPFSFRFWIDDETPPSVGVVSTTARAVALRVRDGGAGVDPASLQADVDGKARPVRFASGLARVSLTGIGRGRHQLVLRAADYQETKNMEDVGPILPNTRTLRTTIVVR